MKKCMHCLAVVFFCILLIPSCSEPNQSKKFLENSTTDQNKNDAGVTMQDVNKRIESDPKDANAYIDRGILKDDMGDKQGAILDYNRAIELDPKNVDAYYDRGIAKADLGDKQGAIKDYGKATDLDPQDTDAYNNRGILKWELEDYKGALEDLDKAIDLGTKDAEAYYDRVIMRGSGSPLDDLNKAIELDPQYAVAYDRRGNEKYIKGDRDGAMQDYNKAIELDPKCAEAYYNRGYLKETLNDAQGALEDRNKVIEAVALLMSEHKGDGGPLIRNIKGVLDIHSCGCFFRFPKEPNPDRYVFFEYYDHLPQMNIDGQNVRLKLVSSSKPKFGTRKGQRFNKNYIAGDAKVRLDFLVTRVCGPKEYDCEYVGYNVTITATRGDRKQSVKVTGDCGC